MLPAMAWRGRSLIMIDQRKLPGQETYVSCSTYIQVAQAIEKMVIRGAPAIGIAAAYGLVVAMQPHRAATGDDFMRALTRSAQQLRNARPTAVNLGWAVDRIVAAADDGV
jgi:methylthioribose-1-phosphate isomerase